MKRRRFMSNAATGAAGIACGYGAGIPAASAPSRPNVVLILTDDQGYGDLGCHGNPAVATPNLDRLHGESVRFTNFYVSPTCSPTRAALLTGRHEFRCGISHTILGRSLLGEDEVTLGDLFRGAGYDTGVFGKWHLGDNHPFRPEDRGFDEVLVHGGGGITQTPDYWGNTYFSPTLRHNGVWTPQDGYCADVYFDAAMEWIGSRGDRPFFAYIPTNTPHEPLQAGEEWREPYTKAGFGGDVAAYYGMITNIDANAGRLLAHLDRLGIAGSTLVIFMTDNGSWMARRDGLYNAGMRGGKGTPYEGGVRVPCFMRWPGRFDGGRDIGTVAAHMDILPTLAGICGFTPPDDRTLDGISLLPDLNGTRTAQPGRLLFTHVGRWDFLDRPEMTGQWSVRSPRYRLMYDGELHDIIADPGQTADVSAAHPGEAGRLRAAFERWWDEMLPSLTTPQRISIGSPYEAPAHLTCMDWHRSLLRPEEPRWRRAPLWMQSYLAAVARREPFMMGDSPAQDGTLGRWMVNVRRSAHYAVTLRKLPGVAPLSWNELAAGSAHVRCGDVHETKEIDPGMTSVTIVARFNAGPSDLECWFTGQRDDGELSGAYFTEVKYLG